MAVPKRKRSKMRVRRHKAANRYQGIQVTRCPACGEPAMPHRACPACGNYKGRQVITVAE